MLVYVATFPNGKKYIGATSRTLVLRMSDHLQASTRVDNKFYRAIRKYGFYSIVFKVIKTFETKERMFLAEKVLIERHQTNIFGYNTSTGGEGNPGRIFTSEDRVKISIAQKKRYIDDPEQRIKSKSHFTKWRTEHPELLKAVAAKNTEYKRTPEYRKAASLRQKKFLKDNPEAAKENGKRISALFEKYPDYRLKISQKLGGTPIEVSKDGVVLAVYPSLSQLCSILKLNIGNVGGALIGRRNHVHGYTFKRVI